MLGRPDYDSFDMKESSNDDSNAAVQRGSHIVRITSSTEEEEEEANDTTTTAIPHVFHNEEEEDHYDNDTHQHPPTMRSSKAPPPTARKPVRRSLRRMFLDDTVGHTTDFKAVTFFNKVMSSLERQRAFLFLNVFVVVAWACLCAWAAEEMHASAVNNPDGTADRWLIRLEAAGSKFRLVGILFVFALVFRFNRCYDRWVQGRSIWGRIISTSLDLVRMTRQWMTDDAFSDRFSRFVIVCSYACKAMLRGNSLADPDAEAGEDLIFKGLLTREELEDMDSHEGWQPQYCLDMLTAILIEAHYPSNAMMFDSSHKVHSQLFRGVDCRIAKLGECIGDAIRVQSSSLPPTYDGLHDLMFYFYFMLGPVFFAPTLGWALPILIGFEAFVIMLVFLMGSELIQPFGLDKVDLPLELFCRTIEKQVQQIDNRGKRQNLRRLARTSVAYPADHDCSSMHKDKNINNTSSLKSRHTKSKSFSRTVTDDYQQTKRKMPHF